MSLSAGLSNSQSQSTATKQSTGPVAFGAVQIAAPAGGNLTLYLAMAAAAVAAWFIFRRK